MKTFDTMYTEKIIEIKASTESVINFKPSKNWEYALEMSFDTKYELFLPNIYLSFKSIANSSHIPCIRIATAWKNSLDKYIINENLNISKFKKINYNEFIDWFEWRIEEGYTQNSQQERQDTFLFFLFSFEKNIFNLKKINLNYLKPKYPWSDNLIFTEFKEVNFLKEKIRRLEEEIKSLKNIK